MARVVEVTPPTDVSIDTMRRQVQQLNRQLQTLQQQLDQLTARVARLE